MIDTTTTQSLALADSFVPVTSLRSPRVVVDERYLSGKPAPALPWVWAADVAEAAGRARRRDALDERGLA
ncbi:MAG: hypothetical protein ACRC50_13525 [Gaiella sp.]